MNAYQENQESCLVGTIRQCCWLMAMSPRSEIRLGVKLDSESQIELTVGPVKATSSAFLCVLGVLTLDVQIDWID